VSAHSNIVAVSRNDLLRFFDDPPRTSWHHATAIVAVAGEELGTGLLVHYLASKGVQASVLSDRCTPGTTKGSRLDAWVDAGPTLYQVEVKNWSAHAYGRKRQLPVDAPPEVTAKYRRDRWNEVWDGNRFRNQSMGKVLLRMRPPRQGGRVEPLIVFWWALHPDGAAEPLFRMPVQRAAFPLVNVFSMSNYLRQCTDQPLLLEMSNTRRRLDWLSSLFCVDKPLAPGDV